MDDLQLAEDLRAAIGTFVRAVRSGDRMPAGQAAVLGHLDRSSPQSIAELARREQVKHQSMTRTVDLLYTQGLITLGRHERDRRQLVVALSPEGRAALTEERENRAAGMAQAIRDKLTDDEREVVRQIPAVLGKLLEA